MTSEALDILLVNKPKFIAVLTHMIISWDDQSWIISVRVYCSTVINLLH